MASSKTTSREGDTWIGGVCGLHGFKHAGKPMRVAAWITSSGYVLGAAIVEAKGPAVLRQLFDELMEGKAPEELPARVIVWPAARAALRDVAHPPVTVERHEFLRVVIEDKASAGRYPRELEVRRG